MAAVDFKPEPILNFGSARLLEAADRALLRLAGRAGV